MSDLETLAALNRDYIASVQNSDVKRFDEILSEDFLNTNPDGVAGRPRRLPQADRAEGEDSRPGVPRR